MNNANNIISCKIQPRAIRTTPNTNRELESLTCSRDAETQQNKNNKPHVNQVH